MKTNVKRLNKFYESYLKDYPDGGGWPSPQIAFECYKASASSALIPWQTIQTVTDVGCGTGKFLAFIRTSFKYRNEYLGIEVVDSLFALAQSNFSTDRLARFVHADFMDIGYLWNKSDWVFCIGTLSTLQEEKNEYDLAFIKKVGSISELGMTLYLNDSRYFNRDRLLEVPDLAIHNITDVIDIIEMEFKPKNIDIINYPRADTSSCAVNVLFK